MITRGWRSGAGVLVALGAVLATAACSDDGGGERIRGYDVLVEVRPDGSLRVSETIQYDFGDEDRHGIERFVPQRLPWTQTRDRVTEIGDVEVVSPTGAPTDLDRSTDGGDVVLRVGDEDEEVSGLQTYVVSYSVDAVATPGPDGDEVVWNAVGTGWEVPVDAATATLDLPDDVTSSGCVAGPAGSREPCEVTAEGAAVVASAQDLEAGEGMTVTAGLAAGTLDTTPVLRDSFSPARAFSTDPLPLALAVLVLAGVLGPVVVRARRGRLGRAASGKSLAASSEPPGGHRPAQLGVLFDGRADAHEVTATLIDLAARGHLRIEETDVDASGETVERGDGDPPAGWRVARVGSGTPDGLRPYERELLHTLFGEGARDESVLLSQVHAERSEGLTRVRSAMHRDALDLRWFTADPALVRRRWYLLGTALLVGGMALTVVLALWTPFGLTGIATATAGLAVLVLAHWMPVRTTEGTRLLLETRRYREWLQQATPDPAVVERHLPYAVALSATKGWKAPLESDAAPATPSWYVGSGQPGNPATWPWLFTLTSSGGSPAATGSTASGVSSGAGGGGGGSW